MSKINWPLTAAVIIMSALIIFLYSVKISVARDNGEYDPNDPIVQWYGSLMQPDVPNSSCCGVADAYWCSDPYVREGKTYCQISDDRVVKNRTPIPVGTEIEIPDNKLMDGRLTKGNPTGHSIVFLNSGGTYVYCFVMDTGI